MKNAKLKIKINDIIKGINKLINLNDLELNL